METGKVIEYVFDIGGAIFVVKVLQALLGLL